MNKKPLAVLGAGVLTVAVLCSTPLAANASSFGPAAVSSTGASSSIAADPIDHIDAPAFDFVTRTADTATVDLTGLADARFSVTALGSTAVLASGTADADGHARLEVPVDAAAKLVVATQSLQGLTSGTTGLQIPALGDAPAPSAVVIARTATTVDIAVGSRVPGTLEARDAEGALRGSSPLAGGQNTTIRATVGAGAEQLSVTLTTAFGVVSTPATVQVGAFGGGAGDTKPAAPTVSSVVRNGDVVDLRVRTSASGQILVRNAQGDVVARQTAANAGVVQLFVFVGPDATTLEVSLLRTGVESDRVRVDVPGSESVTPGAPTVEVRQRTASATVLGVSASVASQIRVTDESGRTIGGGFATPGRVSDITIGASLAAQTVQVVAVVGSATSDAASVALDAVAAPALPAAPEVSVGTRGASSVDLDVTPSAAGFVQVLDADGRALAIRSAQAGQVLRVSVPVSTDAQTLSVNQLVGGQATEATAVDVAAYVAPPAGDGPRVEMSGTTGAYATVRIYGAVGDGFTVRDTNGDVVQRGQVYAGKAYASITVPVFANTKTVSITLTVDGVESAASELALR